MDTMKVTRRDRLRVRVTAAVLLVLALAFPWVEAWPVRDIGALVLEEPILRYADIYPDFGPRAWWVHDDYENVLLRLDVLVLELVAIFATAGWALSVIDGWERAHRAKDRPLYCELGEAQVSAGAISSSGTVGPLG